MNKFRAILEGTTLIGIAMLFVFFGMYLTGNAISKSEINECHQWIQESKSLNAFYVTSEENDQCTAHHINLSEQGVKVRIDL